jgi:hypothetical protein
MDLRDPATRVKVFQCLSSKEWRMRNLYYVKDKEGKKVLFVPNVAQEIFLKEQHGLDLILKARQQGFTTLSCISFLDDCLFQANLSAGVIAHNLEDANSFFNDKIKFAYECLPNDIKQVVKANTDKAGELSFSNGSKIRVRTSFRSGTLQRLHISEFGKICAKSPDKAREIVTGALNAIAAGLQVIIESTAEGKVGYFYDYCEKSRSMARQGTPLTKMDFKFHFFPWWKSPDYQLDPIGVVIPPRLEEYFKKLETEHKITLNPAQKAWYYKKEATMGDDMGREFPSHPDEAFAQAIEGAYYGGLLVQAELEKRVTTVPYEPMLKVHTVWDLGMNDSTAIWFFQVGPGGERRYIDYYENSGETLPHYAQVLQARGYFYGKTILPHDARVRSLETGNTREDALRALGFNDIIIIPAMDPMTRITATRLMLPKCWFDQAKCHDGLEALRQYRKAWDDKAGGWKDGPLHDWTSHAADSFGMSAFADCREIPAPTQRIAKNKFR